MRILIGLLEVPITLYLVFGCYLIVIAFKELTIRKARKSSASEFLVLMTDTTLFVSSYVIIMMMYFWDRFDPNGKPDIWSGADTHGFATLGLIIIVIIHTPFLAYWYLNNVIKHSPGPPATFLALMVAVPLAFSLVYVSVGIVTIGPTTSTAESSPHSSAS